jgi:membrane protease YdiL (CAAX protease family)
VLYTPLDIYAAPATERRGLWRLFVGLVLIVAGWLLWTVLVMSAFVLYKLADGLPVRAALGALSDFISNASPASVIFQLSTFAGVWPATWLAVWLLHGQSFGSLLSPERRMRWGDFLGGLALAGGFWVITLMLGVAAVGVPERSALPLETWALAFVPLAVVVFFQASAEELVFRGYILQQLAARWSSPLVWAALPAFLFGLAHYANGSGSGLGVHYVAVTLAFGLAAAALVWRTGSLAAAMGLHTGMNMLSLSGIGLKGLVEGNQLFLYEGGAKTLFLADGAGTVCILLFVLSPLCPFRSRQVLPG